MHSDIEPQLVPPNDVATAQTETEDVSETD